MISPLEEYKKARQKVLDDWKKELRGEEPSEITEPEVEEEAPEEASSDAIEAEDVQPEIDSRLLESEVNDE